MFRRFSANFALFSMALDGLMIALTLFVSAKLRVDMSTLPLVRPVEDPVQLPWLPGAAPGGVDSLTSSAERA